MLRATFFFVQSGGLERSTPVANRYGVRRLRPSKTDMLIHYWGTPLKLVFFVQHRGLEGSTPVVSQYSLRNAFVDFVVENHAPVRSVLKI